MSCFLLALAALAWGQAPPAASLTGVVLDDATGAPVPRTVVTIRTSGSTEDAVAWSDASGAFAFSPIPPETYSLDARHAGYETARFTLPLAPGEERRLVVRIRAVGSISGTVSDADGDPVLHASVELLPAANRSGPLHRSVAHVTTDDRGRYHLQGIRPGRYLLVAFSHEHPPGLSVTTVGQPAEELASGLQFYPKSDRLSAAAPITLGPRQDLDGFDFRLVPQPATSIEGSVILPPTTAPDTPVYVRALSEDTIGFGGSSQVAVNRADGSFHLQGLLWGRYVVDTDLTARGRGYHGMERVEAGQEPGRVTIRLDPLAEVPGAVRIAGGTGGLPQHLRIRLVPRDPVFQLMNLDPEAEVGADGAFRFESLPPGAWAVEPAGLPEGWYLESARLGDLDVLAANMPVSPGTNAALDIVLGAQGAVLEGGSKPAAHILLAPAGPLANLLSRYYTTTSDAAGLFKISGIAPGAYRLYAFDRLDAEPGEYPDLVRSLGDSGESVELAAGSHTSRQVGPVSTAPLEEAK